ncbi:MAG: DUF3857 domain-containing protein [Bacteroidales bacterium]|nr:DUF3857 domain-containing protein [Bacteroidales bacterium]
MKTTKTLLILALSLLYSTMDSYCQNFSHEFGQITTPDIDLQTYDKDPDAEAVIIYDIGESKFLEEADRFYILFKRQTRIKILKESGLNYAEIEIPYYHEGEIFEKVIELEAYTYTFEEGKLNKTQLDVNTIYDEQRNEYWKVKKFAMPNVKPGSIIEYKYTIKSPYLFNLQDWEFQHRIPTLYSEYVAKLIPFYEYIYIVQGTNKMDIMESYEDKGMPRHFGTGGAYGSNEYHDMVYRFGMKDVPAFQDETFITSLNDYVMKLDFQLTRIHRLDGIIVDIIKTWEELNDELLKHEDFGKYLNVCERNAKQIVKEENLLLLNEKERFDFIVNYTKSQFKWNGTYGEYASKSGNSFMKEKTGNIGNINLFLTSFLNAAEIEASPVLLSTRDHGKIKSDYPFLHFINYVAVIAKVDGNFILTDGSEPFCPNNAIPPNCHNENGIIVKKNAEEWVNLTKNETSKVIETFEIQFNNSMDSAICKAKLQYTLFEALYMRKKFGNNIEEIKDAINKKGFNVLDSITTSNYVDKDKPYYIVFKSSIPTQIIDDKIYISPFFNEVPDENPFKFKDRKYPIDITYTKLSSFTSIIKLPDGYSFSHIPASYETMNNIVSINYKFTKMDDRTLTINASYKFEKNLYDTSEYARLKFYFDKIVSLFNEKVIIEKR